MLDFQNVYDTDYHEFNSGAHRNSPKNLYAPTLVWHLAFWIDVGPSPGPRSSDTSVKKKVDSYIMGLCRQVAARAPPVKLFPRVSDKILLFATIVDPEHFCELSIDEDGLSRREKEIFDSGMRCVTIEFIWKGLIVTIRSEFQSEHVIFTIFVELSRARPIDRYSELDTLNDNMKRMVAYLRSDSSQPYDASMSNYFYFDFWESMTDELVGKNLFNKLQEDDTFHRIFADFRGVVFSDAAARFGEFEKSQGNTGNDWGIEAKKKLLPILKLHQTLRLKKYECAINYMLDGRALYMSSLAPQLPETPLEIRIPVQYVIYVHHRSKNDEVIVNKWQLGRLVSLIHHLGVCRLAALKDIKFLHDVGRRVAQIDERIQKARNSVVLEDPNAMLFVQAAHQEMNDINRNFLDQTARSIPYRIERSRYYVKQFDVGKKGLRIRRLEGDQPYDQFVERRLGAQYDFIDRLGIRFERTTKNIADIDQHYLSLKAANIGKEAVKANAEIKAIQEWGEFLLLLILIPYYLTHLVNMILVERLEPYAALLIWAVFGTIAFWRKMGKRGLLASLSIVVVTSALALSLHFAGVGCFDFLRFCSSLK